MRRLATVLASLTILAGLSACCCPCGGFPRGAGGGPAVNINVPPIVVPQPPNGNVNQPDDPAITAIKARGGSVQRDGGQPGEPVIEVDLGFKNLNDGDLQILLAPFPQLRKLRLGQNQGVSGTGFRNLALPRLEDLDLGFNPTSDEGMKAIAAFRQLKVLNISNAKLTDRGIREVAKLDQLQELNASGMLLNGPNRNEPTDNAIKELGRCRQLRKLDLANTQAADLSAKNFANLSHLKILHVYGTRIGDAGIAEIAKLKQLEELRIGSNVNDAGVKSLADHPSIQVLALMNNLRLTSACLPTLATLRSLRELEISGVGMAALKNQAVKALPNVNVK